MDHGSHKDSRETLADVLPPGRSKSGARPWSMVIKDWIRSAFVDNFSLKFVALVLSLTLFVLVHTEKNVDRSFQVSVSYPSFDDRVLVSKRVDNVRVTLQGPQRRLKRVEDSDFERIVIRLENTRNGSFRVRKDLFDVPEGLEIAAVEPDNIPVEYESRISKEVPVVVDSVGTPAAGYRVSNIEISPKTVTISGADSVVRSVDRVRTNELQVDLTGKRAPFTTQVNFRADGFDVTSARGGVIDVTIVEELERREFGTVSVDLRSLPGVETSILGRFNVTPNTVRVVAFGGAAAIQQLDGSNLKLFVEVGSLEVNARRKWVAEVRVDSQVENLDYQITPSQVVVAPR